MRSILSISHVDILMGREVVSMLHIDTTRRLTTYAFAKEYKKEKRGCRMMVPMAMVMMRL